MVLKEDRDGSQNTTCLQLAADIGVLDESLRMWKYLVCRKLPQVFKQVCT